ncbi:MAG: hypothetical protein MUF65_01345 [Rubritepida sp.]|jgi:hypothetical protein|nr:hypothetical protein [Rubritepida sp.]MCU0943997.1 hypothetical protein [Rubritepida sp.]
MSGSPLPGLDRIPVERYQPITFLERGVALPCTTPLLLGSRMRPAERVGFELVIANPGGGQGVYIVPWAALPEICVPTLHDLRLWKILSDLPLLTPSAVREAARAVAVEGFAGRAASTAAAAAQEARNTLRIRANFLLVMRVIRQMETVAEGKLPPERDTPERIEARAKRALARIAHQVGSRPEDLAAELEELAALVQDVGVPGDTQLAPARRQVADIRAMAEDVATWYAMTPAAQDLRVGEVIAQATELTLRCCELTFAEIDKRLTDIAALLRAWRQERPQLQSLAARPDWLLDGWAAICALWTEAAPTDRLAVSREIALMVPLVPREAEGWTGLQADWNATMSLRKRVRALEDWRTGRMIDLTERNERLRAVAA